AGSVVDVGDWCSSGYVGDGEIVIADPTATGFAIKEPGAIGESEPGSQRCDKSIIGSHHEKSTPGYKHPVARIVVVSRPVKVPFNPENDVVELGVVPKLAASDKYAVASVVELEAEEAVTHLTMKPSAPDVAAQIEARPTTNWRRRRWR